MSSTVEPYFRMVTAARNDKNTIQLLNEKYMRFIKIPDFNLSIWGIEVIVSPDEKLTFLRYNFSREVFS